MLEVIFDGQKLIVHVIALPSPLLCITVTRGISSFCLEMVGSQSRIGSLREWLREDLRMALGDIALVYRLAEDALRRLPLGLHGTTPQELRVEEMPRHALHGRNGEQLKESENENENEEEEEAADEEEEVEKKARRVEASQSVMTAKGGPTVIDVYVGSDSDETPHHVAQPSHHAAPTINAAAKPAQTASKPPSKAAPPAKRAPKRQRSESTSKTVATRRSQDAFVMVTKKVCMP